MLNRHIQATANDYGSLLDARVLAEIKAEESAVKNNDIDEESNTNAPA